VARDDGEKNVTLEVKNLPANVKNITVNLSYTTEPFEEFTADEKTCHVGVYHGIINRRYKTYANKDKIPGFFKDNQILSSININFDINNKIQNFEFKTTSYGGDTFNIIATTSVNLNSEIKSIKKLQVWKKYQIKTYWMTSILNANKYKLPDLSEVNDKFKDSYIAFDYSTQETTFPDYEIVIKSPNPLNDYEIKIQNFINKISSEVVLKKQNKFLNILVANYLMDWNSSQNDYDKGFGFTCGNLNEFPEIGIKNELFYSTIISGKRIIETNTSNIKTFIHEIGHSFGIDHHQENIENNLKCCMFQGGIQDSNYHKFCPTCIKLLKNNNLFIDGIEFIDYNRKRGIKIENN